MASREITAERAGHGVGALGWRVVTCQQQRLTPRSPKHLRRVAARQSSERRARAASWGLAQVVFGGQQPDENRTKPKVAVSESTFCSCFRARRGGLASQLEAGLCWESAC